MVDALADAVRERREARETAGREKAPKLWALLDLIVAEWRQYDYQQLAVIFGDRGSVEIFEVSLALAQRLALEGVEASEPMLARMRETLGLFTRRDA